MIFVARAGPTVFSFFLSFFLSFFARRQAMVVLVATAVDLMPLLSIHLFASVASHIIGHSFASMCQAGGRRKSQHYTAYAIFIN